MTAEEQCNWDRMRSEFEFESKEALQVLMAPARRRLINAQPLISASNGVAPASGPHNVRAGCNCSNNSNSNRSQNRSQQIGSEYLSIWAIGDGTHEKQNPAPDDNYVE